MEPTIVLTTRAVKPSRALDIAQQQIRETRVKRLALGQRVSAGFDYLQGMVERGDTGETYERHFKIWDALRREYEQEA